MRTPFALVALACVAIAGAAFADASSSAPPSSATRPAETPEQRVRKGAYIQTTRAKIVDICDKDGRARTREEHKLIKHHWRRSMRLLRIREIAEDEKDKKSMDRADLQLKKVDERFFAKLGELAAKAPPKAAGK